MRVFVNFLGLLWILSYVYQKSTIMNFSKGVENSNRNGSIGKLLNRLIPRTKTGSVWRTTLRHSEKVATHPFTQVIATLSGADKRETNLRL